MDPTSPIVPEQAVNLKGPDGRTIPYMHCIEVSVEVDFITGKELVVPALVVPTIEYHKEVPVIVGTNIISRYQERCKHEHSENVTAEWQRAFLAVQAGFLGSVRSTNKTNF